MLAVSIQNSSFLLYDRIQYFSKASLLSIEKNMNFIKVLFDTKSLIFLTNFNNLANILKTWHPLVFLKTAMCSITLYWINNRDGRVALLSNLNPTRTRLILFLQTRTRPKPETKIKKQTRTRPEPKKMSLFKTTPDQKPFFFCKKNLN